MKLLFTTRGFILAYLYKHSAAFDELLRAFHTARRKGIVLGTEEDLLADLR